MMWFKIYRENGLVEIACEHGVGHPSQKLTPPQFYYGTHGCDGCCTTVAWVRAEQTFFDHADLEMKTLYDDS